MKTPTGMKSKENHPTFKSRYSQSEGILTHKVFLDFSCPLVCSKYLAIVTRYYLHLFSFDDGINDVLRSNNAILYLGGVLLLLFIMLVLGRFNSLEQRVRIMMIYIRKNSF